MSPLTYLAFAGSLAVLFSTPGPGIMAMVGRTLNRGPVYGAAYGLGITLGDIFWLGVAVTGLSAAADAASDYEGWFWVAKLIGASILLYFAWNSFQAFRHPKAMAGLPTGPISKTGLAATVLAGISMPLSNPKAIAFYLSFVPAFFDLSLVGPSEFALMATILMVMSLIFIGGYVALAHHARDWLTTKGFKRWADLVTAVLMASIAIFLLVR